jgi:uncharacterized protein (DUF2236 family)
MLQTLHPLAMAGVVGHSRFREDPIGRLQRTARFVAGTTFGATPLANALFAEVQRAHVPVRGTTADGQRYSARDPRLLTWVHTTEVWSFLNSFQRYGRRPLLRSEKDRYLDEVAIIGERLGARNVPRSVAQVREYLQSMRAELEVTPQARETIQFLRTPVRSGASEAISQKVLADAAIDLLPRFARTMLGLTEVPLIGTAVSRTAAHSLARLLRWAVGPSMIAALAAERAGAQSERIAASST